LNLSLFGILHIVSAIVLTGVVALVIGLQEAEPKQHPARHVLGCWAKMLGGLLCIGLIVFVLSLFSCQ